MEVRTKIDKTFGSLTEMKAWLLSNLDVMDIHKIDIRKHKKDLSYTLKMVIVERIKEGD